MPKEGQSVPIVYKLEDPSISLPLSSFWFYEFPVEFYRSTQSEQIPVDKAPRSSELPRRCGERRSAKVGIPGREKGRSPMTVLASFPASSNLSSGKRVGLRIDSTLGRFGFTALQTKWDTLPPSRQEAHVHEPYCMAVKADGYFLSVSLESSLMVALSS